MWYLQVTRASLEWHIWETDTVWMSQDDDRTKMKEAMMGIKQSPDRDRTGHVGQGRGSKVFQVLEPRLSAPGSVSKRRVCCWNFSRF